jgi:hypothetical protein
MRRERALRISLAALLLVGLVLALSLPGANGLFSSAPGPGAAPAAAPLNGSSPPPSTPGFPTTISCPLPPVSVGGMSFNCIFVLNLTTVVLVLFGIMVILYVYKDADQAELPGEAEEVPVTGEEELEFRLRKEREREAERRRP